MGYDLSPIFQGQGIMNEATMKVLDFGFNKLHLDKIEAFTNKQNERSKKLLFRNNFKWNTSRIDTDDLDNLIYEIYKVNYRGNS